MLMSLKLSQSVPVPERLTWVKLSKNNFFIFRGGNTKKWGLITRWKKMEEICIRGKVGTQNQELNSKVIVSRVCGLKFVFRCWGGEKGFWMFTPFIFYSLVARSSPLSFFPASELVCLHLSVIAWGQWIKGGDGRTEKKQKSLGYRRHCSTPSHVINSGLLLTQEKLLRQLRNIKLTHYDNYISVPCSC